MRRGWLLLLAGTAFALFACAGPPSGEPSPAAVGDTISFGMGQRAIIEFTLPTVGRCMFHPHQHWLAERGSMGWFAAV